MVRIKLVLIYFFSSVCLFILMLHHINRRSECITSSESMDQDFGHRSKQDTSFHVHANTGNPGDTRDTGESRQVHVASRNGAHTVFIGPVDRAEMEKDLGLLDHQSRPRTKLRLCPKSIVQSSDDTPAYQLSPSGVWSPSSCRPRHVIAVVVPYRDRRRHLQYFLAFLPQYLRGQWLAYCIIVVEQKSPAIFNRGYVLNIGLTEAQKLVSGLPCVIFHDVDLVPESEGTSYTCRHDVPVHLGAYVNSSDYQLTRGITGGVLAITPHQMEQVNGYSNTYWGWGGEDADLYNRLSARGIRVMTGDYNTTRYRMLPHGPDKHNPVIRKRFHPQLTNWAEDGLNSLNYTIASSQLSDSHTHIVVAIQVDAMTEKWLQEKYKP